MAEREGRRVSPQQAHVQEIHYEDAEGNEYSEVHGDFDKNLEVTTFAEKEGGLQPNEYGTTPDPFEPEMTDFEKERRGQVEESTQPETEKQESTRERQLGGEQRATQQKQGQRAQDKQAGSTTENK